MGIKIGIVGAGGNTRLRHIPGFRALDDVELVGVVTRQFWPVAAKLPVRLVRPTWVRSASMGKNKDE